MSGILLSLCFVLCEMHRASDRCLGYQSVQGAPITRKHRCAIRLWHRLTACMDTAMLDISTEARSVRMFDASSDGV